MLELLFTVSYKDPAVSLPVARRASGKEDAMIKRKSPKTSCSVPDMPYEKFLNVGAGSLTEAELLAIIIRTGTKGNGPVELGKQILELPSVREQGLSGLYHVSLKELMKLNGIGQVKAVKIKCLAELAMRMAMAKAQDRLQFGNPASVANYYMEKLRHEKKEQVLLLLLDNRSALMEECLLSVGTVNMSLLSPREVFVTALRAEAVNIMLLHNHPGGDPSPSRQDLMITDRIRKIGDMVDIPLIDHIIIGNGRYMSFRETGLLK